MKNELLPSSSDELDAIVAATEAATHEIMATTIGVENVEIVQPGRLMEAIIAADSLFLPDSTEVRKANIPLVDRIISSLSSRPASAFTSVWSLLSAARTSPTP